jgi:hypothetical protein
MDNVIFGDNQFFAVSHLSDERSRAQAMRFRDTSAIISVLEQARDMGITTFMCTTHDRIGEFCTHIRANPDSYKGYKIYPCMPYAHKYANAVTDLGILGMLQKYLKGNIIGSLAKGGVALARKDFRAILELLVDSEMHMFAGIDTPVIFLQNVIVDMILGLGMIDLFKVFAEHVNRKYNAEAGFITMNLPLLHNALKDVGVSDPVICASINKVGFRMCPNKQEVEELIAKSNPRIIAMQVLAAGAVRPREAFEYACSLKGVDSILFGASTASHISESKELIEMFFSKR